ncbi:esterase [Microbacterium phage Jacko]|nr:esterase [Microbacterium phage Jacko]
MAITVPAPPVENQDPWFEERDAFDQAVRSRLNEDLAPDALSALIVERSGPSAGLRWIPVGDSLTSEQGGGAPDIGWTVQASMLSNGQLAPVRNAGISGNTSADIRARLAADVLAYSPNLVSLWCGVNDITQGRTLAQFQADYRAIVDDILETGASVALFTIPPRDDLTKQATITAWNGWIRALAAEKRLNLVDAYAAISNPSTGDILSGFGSGDGVHLSASGHNSVAQQFVAIMSERLPAGGIPMRPLVNDDPNNLLSNALLLNAPGGTPTGWYPGGNSSVGVVEGLVDDADFRGGKAWQVEATNPGGYREIVANGGSDWAVGDTLLFVCRAKVVSSSGVTTFKGLHVNANFFGAASPTQFVTRNVSVPGLNGIIAKRLVVPAGTTGPVQVAVLFDFDSTASQTTRVGEFGIFNLTRLGLE